MEMTSAWLNLTFFDYYEQVWCLQKEHVVRTRRKVQLNVTQSICARAAIIPHSALTFLLLNNSSAWSQLPSWIIDLIVWKCPQCFAWVFILYTAPSCCCWVWMEKLFPVLEAEFPGLCQLLWAHHTLPLKHMKPSGFQRNGECEESHGMGSNPFSFSSQRNKQQKSPQAWFCSQLSPCALKQQNKWQNAFPSP